MNRIILNIEENVTDMQAMAAAMSCIEMGKVSKTANGDQYCFLSVTKSGVEIMVTKRKSGTETFFIRASARSSP